jgi:hypothetical protein
MVSKFLDRNIIEKPACPFCGMHIERPRELSTRLPSEMPVGACDCGAVYAYDVTGHNLGTAMIEALVFSCNGDWDLAWDLLPDDDYVEKQVEHYDIETNRIIHSSVYQGRRISGTLYFIKLHGDIREVTEEGTQKRLKKTKLKAKSPSDKKKPMKSLSKREVEDLVRKYDMTPLMVAAEHDKRIIRNLQRLIYAVDPEFRLKAIDALGQVSAVIAKQDPGVISKLLQRLFTAVSDTAASSWGCIDAIGSIIGKSPEPFAGYTPQLYPYLRDRALLAEVLRALGHIGESKPDILKSKAFYFMPLLQDANTEIRGHAVILLGHLCPKEIREDLSNLVDDDAALDIYGDGAIHRTTIGRLASEVLEKT